MAANHFTIYPKLPDVGFQALTASDSNRDGTPITTSLFPVQAAVEGSRVDRLLLVPKTISAAICILKIFINNGSAWSSSANNILYKDYALPVIPTLLEARTEEILLNLALPPGYRIGVLIESASPFNWAITAEGGIY